MIRDGLPWIDPDGATIIACGDERERIGLQTDRTLEELLATWGHNEITALIRVLEILRDSHTRTAERYRQLSTVPRPYIVQCQIDYDTHAASALNHAIGCLMLARGGGHANRK